MTIDARFAVYVGDECMARFVHVPDAAHYRQQLIHRIRDAAPDLPAPLVAAGVSVRDEAPAAVMPTRVWLLWDGHQLVSTHATSDGADDARRERLELRHTLHLGTTDTDEAVTVTTENIRGVTATIGSAGPRQDDSRQSGV